MNKEKYKEYKSDMIKTDRMLCEEIKKIIIEGIHPLTYSNIWQCFFTLHLDMFSLFECVEKEDKES